MDRAAFGAAVLVLLLANEALAHIVRPDRGAFENGVRHTLAALDQALPLLGLALGLARADARVARAGIGCLCLGCAAGLVSAEFLVPAALPMLAPSGLLLVGAALLVGPEASFVTIVASVWTGTLLGLGLALDAPYGLSWTHFAFGVLATAAVVFAVPFALVLRFARARVRVPARILGSWLLTVGILLYGLKLRA
jgi:hypothetical protein